MSVIEELRAKAAKKKAGQVQPVIDTTAVEKAAAPEPEPEPAPPDVPADTKLPPKRRGRPPGSKNAKAQPAAEAQAEALGAVGEVEGLVEAAAASVAESLEAADGPLYRTLRLATTQAASLGFRLTFTLTAGE